MNVNGFAVKVHFLGTSSGSPSKQRNMSATAVALIPLKPGCWWIVPRAHNMRFCTVICHYITLKPFVLVTYMAIIAMVYLGCCRRWR